MPSFRRSLALAFAGLGLARAASAQSRATLGAEPSVRFGIAGGVVIPRTGASTRSLENGLHGQAFALVRLPAGLPALRINVDYDHMRFGQPTTSTGASAGSAVDATRTLLDGVAGMRLDLLHGPVRPYALAGIGAFDIRDVAASVASSSTNFGVDGGAGIAFRLGRVDGFLETRLRNVYTKQQGLIDTKSIQSFPIAFGLTF
jgi:hypothetical protein